MSSGNKRVVFNTQERVVSTDLNRMQAFLGRDIAEFLRAVFESETNLDAQANAIETIYDSLGTPGKGVVIGGLRVQPQIGTTACTIGPGLIGITAPESPLNPDDSPFKWVNDPGLDISHALFYTPTASSGGIRIDRIECSYSEVTLENAARNIYNPATSTFTTTAVDKVRSGRLTYRIVRGTQGGGMPAFTAGWLPLAVVSSPNNSLTWDTATVWDVRPLAVDREFAPFLSKRELSRPKRQLMYSQNTTTLSTASPTKLSGYEENVFGGYNAGGVINKGTPGTQTDGVDIADTTNQEPGFLFAGNRQWYLWHLFPFGLPRWARYTDVFPFGVRVPASPRGIPVVTTKGPSDMRGLPVSPIAFPTSTGLAGAVGTNTSDAVMSAHGYIDLDDLPHGVLGSGDITYDILGSNLGALDISFPAASTNNDASLFVFSDNTQFPANIRALHCTFEATLNNGTSAIHATLQNLFDVEYIDSTDTALTIQGESVPIIIPNATTFIFNFRTTVRIPMIPTYPWVPGIHVRRINWRYLLSNAPPNGYGTLPGPISNVRMKIIGWEDGP